MTEVDRIPPDWVEALNQVDEVWTVSGWSRTVFADSGVTRPIRIVPGGVDPGLFKVKTNSSQVDGKYRFLTVGKLEERKNYAALFRAYVDEFKPTEPVELIVHFGHITDPREVFSKVFLPRRHAPIRFSPAVAREQMVDLYHSADAFVLPTRGEGWGLAIMEAMCCGLPVITTGIGPILEYANPATALLLDYDLVTAGDPRIPIFDEVLSCGCWADPHIEQLRYFMRCLFENRQLGQEMGQLAAAEIRAKWDWTNAVTRARQALAEA
jgi:glycosyltransferase involved in cell wall biosynthesis